MKRFLQDFENMVSTQAHVEFARVRALAESLIERLTGQAEGADKELLTEIDRAKSGAADLIADIDTAADDAENMTLGKVRDLHDRAQEIGLV